MKFCELVPKILGLWLGQHSVTPSALPGRMHMHAGHPKPKPWSHGQRSGAPAHAPVASRSPIASHPHSTPPRTSNYTPVSASCLDASSSAVPDTDTSARTTLTSYPTRALTACAANPYRRANTCSNIAHDDIATATTSRRQRVAQHYQRS